MTRVCAAATMIVAITFSACTRRTAEYGRSHANARFRDVVQFRFEATNFTACGSSELWWLSIADPNDPAWLHVDAIYDDSCAEPTDRYCGLIYIEADGSLSAPGNHGHLGMYARELLVSRVLFASLAIPPTCRVAPSSREHNPFTPAPASG